MSIRNGRKGIFMGARKRRKGKARDGKGRDLHEHSKGKVR